MATDDHSTEEEWRAIPGYEGFYEASNLGRVRSLDREYVRRDGIRTRRKGKVLTPTINTYGRRQVYLCLPGEKQNPQLVHRLVLQAFVGPCPDGMEACHWDDDHTNNRLDNLRWDTRVNNYRDRERNGILNYKLKTHCVSGHEYTEENTYVNPNTGHRLCRPCHREYDRNRRPRRSAKAQVEREN